MTFPRHGQRPKQAKRPHRRSLPSLQTYRPQLEELEPRCLLSLSSTAWTDLGPAPVVGGAYPASGRVTVAVPDPNHANIMYVAGDSGGSFFGDGAGIWRTTQWTQPNPVWTPLTDNLPSLDIAPHGMTASAGNPAVFYAAANGPDGGILRSNGGLSWTPTQAASQFPDAKFGAIIVDPTNADLVYVAVLADPFGKDPGGVWQSADGGKTFTNITPADFGPVFASDLAIDPSHPATLYAGIVGADSRSHADVDGVYRITVDPSGQEAPQWTQLTNGIAHGSAEVGNFIRLAMAPSNPQVLYASVFGPGNSDASPKLKVFRTGTGGDGWDTVYNSSSSAAPFQPDFRDWHAVLAVDPADPNVFYLNGDEPELHRGTFDPTTRTVSFARLEPEYPNGGTEDVLGVTFDDSGHVVLLGDRGIGWSSNPPAQGSFQPQQGNLETNLIYRVAVDPRDPGTAYAVAQDQLSALKTADSLAWSRLETGGEIGSVVLDSGNPDVVYNLATPDQLLLTRSTQAGAPGSWQSIAPAAMLQDFESYPSSSRFDEVYFRALAADPFGAGRVLVGSFRVWQTTDGGNTWQPISPALSATSAPITAITAAAGNKIYAATLDGGLFVTPSDRARTPRWQSLATPWKGSSASPAYVVSLAIDPRDPRYLIVVANVPVESPEGGTGASVGQVWLSRNGGRAWTNITGDIPSDYAITSVAVDWRNHTPVLYVGTSRGVFRSTDLGGDWARFGLGLPNTKVTDLEFLPQTDEGVLAAATYGRGVFEIQVPEPSGRGSSMPGSPHDSERASAPCSSSPGRTILTPGLPPGHELGLWLTGQARAGSPGKQLRALLASGIAPGDVSLGRAGWIALGKASR